MIWKHIALPVLGFSLLQAHDLSLRVERTLMGWRFALPQDTDLSRTSITFLFRSPAIYSSRIPTLTIRPWAPGLDSAELPQRVVDPGYPVTSIAQG